MLLIVWQLGATLKAMNERQAKFVKEYCVDFNATQAALRAGYPQASARQKGSELLSKPDIKAGIEERKEQLAAIAEVDQAWVLRQWKQIATADPNDLMQLRRVCCRHCHGYGHAYQWTEGEYMAAVNHACDSGKEAPAGDGGFGFNPNAAPHPQCPECGGTGVELVHIADTRKLTGNAKRLYAGVHKTKDGLKILTRDQDAALANISKFLGMTLEKREISGPGGGPVTVANIKAEDLTDEQLAAIVIARGADV